APRGGGALYRASRDDNAGGAPPVLVDRRRLGVALPDLLGARLSGRRPRAPRMRRGSTGPHLVTARPGRRRAAADRARRTNARRIRLAARCGPGIGRRVPPPGPCPLPR